MSRTLQHFQAVCMRLHVVWRPLVVACCSPWHTGRRLFTSIALCVVTSDRVIASTSVPVFDHRVAALGKSSRHGVYPVLRDDEKTSFDWTGVRKVSVGGFESSSIAICICGRLPPLSIALRTLPRIKQFLLTPLAADLFAYIPTSTPSIIKELHRLNVGSDQNVSVTDAFTEFTISVARILLGNSVGLGIFRRPTQGRDIGILSAEGSADDEKAAWAASEAVLAGAARGRVEREDSDQLNTVLTLGGALQWLHNKPRFLYGQERCLRMLEEHERGDAEGGTLYTQVVYSRWDMYWLADHPPASFLGSEYLWVPEGVGNLIGLINDRHGIMPRGHAAAYFDSIGWLENGSALTILKSGGYDLDNPSARISPEEWLMMRMLFHKVPFQTFPSVAYIACDSTSFSRCKFGGFKYVSEHMRAHRTAWCALNGPASKAAISFVAFPEGLWFVGRGIDSRTMWGSAMLECGQITTVRKVVARLIRDSGAMKLEVEVAVGDGLAKLLQRVKALCLISPLYWRCWLLFAVLLNLFGEHVETGHEHWYVSTMKAILSVALARELVERLEGEGSVAAALHLDLQKLLNAFWNARLHSEPSVSTEQLVSASFSWISRNPWLFPPGPHFSFDLYTYTRHPLADVAAGAFLGGVAQERHDIGEELEVVIFVGRGAAFNQATHRWLESLWFRPAGPNLTVVSRADSDPSMTATTCCERLHASVVLRRFADSDRGREECPVAVTEDLVTALVDVASVFDRVPECCRALFHWVSLEVATLCDAIPGNRAAGISRGYDEWTEVFGEVVESSIPFGGCDVSVLRAARFSANFAIRFWHTNIKTCTGDGCVNEFVGSLNCLPCRVDGSASRPALPTSAVEPHIRGIDDLRAFLGGLRYLFPFTWPSG
eukprot:TRINITY_DN33353_c0_g1_i1.p1 TRINITY_DN33353_c0_g1~~TRINITY_DN33353_c0_g1_i1.p1  ORF type:complete len:888 (+),score=80.72 TRINITY_DN33353_c0_g1_i1:195-2858(+)